MRLRLDAIYPPQFKSHAQNERRARQGSQGAIKKAAAIAQAITGCVKRIQWNDKNVRTERLPGQGRWDAKGIDRHGCFWRPGAKKERRLWRDDHRQGRRRACRAPDFDGCAHIRLLPDRPVKRDAIAGRLWKDLQQMRDNLPRPRRQLCWRAVVAGGKACRPQRLAAVFRHGFCLPALFVFHVMLLSLSLNAMFPDFNQ
jgi:hypothetical protein